MTKNQNPNEIELLDLWNEVGGKMVIKYHRATITPDKGDLQQLRDKGFNTDVMTCILQAFVGHGKSEQETLAFMQEAEAADATPSVTFEAAEDEGLNIKSREDNPILEQMIQTIENQ